MPRFTTKTIRKRLSLVPKIWHGANHGARYQTDDGGIGRAVCVMEAVSFIAGEQITDHPSCVDTTMSDFLIRLNDTADEEQRQRLRPYVVRLVGTRSATADQLQERGRLMREWAARMGEKYGFTARGAGDVALAIEYAVVDGGRTMLDEALPLVDQLIAVKPGVVEAQLMGAGACALPPLDEDQGESSGVTPAARDQASKETAKLVLGDIMAELATAH